ncbi:hypothetical protein AVEN_204460-1 [Araneus ventricosus]|uniref:Uncharacterized protein n=1 Tax=Araneus ventricosus TaxID=182803 RepID=A0A4Y2NPD0_ARAVE|nr:hypothetical protein AVEN_204460-1 [Araneus ventricosus]
MIWREPGTRYRAPNIVERDHYRGGRLLVWAGIATNGRTDLYVFAGVSVTAVRYREEILHTLVLPFIAAMGTDTIFMDDNARQHRARLVRSYLESETIPQMAWSARSADLNPIEHVWDMLGRRIAGQSVPQGTLHELQQALPQEWVRVNKGKGHNMRSTTLLPAWLAVVKHAFQLEGIMPVISLWFPLHILPTNFGCRAPTAVIYAL